jgi:two-component system, cell cycle sensor histidine kinase and response regulator CckA
LGCFCSTAVVRLQSAVPTLQPELPQPKLAERRGTILLVEDESFVRRVTCQILCDAGYGVLEAGTANEASVVFRSCPAEVRLLLTDVVLPDRNGRELSRELTSSYPNLRTLFISGYPENAVTGEGLQGRGWFYLPKPFSQETLLERIRQILAPDNEVES